MKFKINKRTVALGIAVCFTALSACKTETAVLPGSNNLASLKKFIGISFNVDQNKVIYDNKSNEFIIMGNKYSREKIEAIYAKSNEYKLKYER